MKGYHSIALLVLLTAGLSAPGWGAFSTRGQVALSASVTVSSGAVIIINASPLSTEAFFGMNVVMPVEVQSFAPVINPVGLQVRIVYSLFDINGVSTGLGIVSTPITLTRDPVRTNTLVGSAVIPRTDLEPIQQGGRIDYMFHAIQNGAGSLRGLNGPASGPASPLTALPDPYQTTIINEWCQPIGPAGARVSAPDLSVQDGQTAVSLAPGAVVSPGTLCIKTEDVNGWPPGPGGAKPVAVYSINLQNTSLASPAELILSYPADVTGKVLGSNADPSSLGMYWLNSSNAALSSGDWRVLSRSHLDSTLHTLTGVTGHFSTFALFAVGAVGSSTLRPSERIITPNGDGINDTVSFGSGIDDVNIFDIRGRRVRTIAGPTPSWNGQDDDGKVVESGVYLYQYMSQGDRVSGVIGVAK